MPPPPPPRFNRNFLDIATATSLTAACLSLTRLVVVVVGRILMARHSRKHDVPVVVIHRGLLSVPSTRQTGAEIFLAAIDRDKFIIFPFDVFHSVYVKRLFSSFIRHRRAHEDLRRRHDINIEF